MGEANMPKGTPAETHESQDSTSVAPTDSLDANAFKKPPEEIRKHLRDNIDAGQVPDKDEIIPFVSAARKDSQKRIAREIGPSFEERLLSGDPEERRIARDSLRDLTNIEDRTPPPSPREPQDVSTREPDIVPRDELMGRLYNKAMGKLVKLLGKTQTSPDPNLERDTLRKINGLRDPGAREETIKKVLSED